MVGGAPDAGAADMFTRTRCNVESDLESGNGLLLREQKMWWWNFEIVSFAGSVISG